MRRRQINQFRAAAVPPPVAPSPVEPGVDGARGPAADLPGRPAPNTGRPAAKKRVRRSQDAGSGKAKTR